MGGLDFSKVKKASFGGGRSDRENVAIEFRSVDVANERQPTPAEDVLHGYLLHDALGLRAEFKADGTPLTEVKVRINEKRKSKLTGAHAPLEIYNLPRKSGNHKPVHPGGVVVLENSYLEERTGTIVTGWLSVASRNPAEALETAHTGQMVTVEAERYTVDKESNEKKYRQNRLLALAADAATFGSLKEFKDNAAEFLKENNAGGGGRPGFYVRIIDSNDPTQIVQSQITATWDSQNEKLHEAETIVDAWLADPENAQWAAFVNAADQPDGQGYIFEQIPFYRYGTGLKSLPSMSEKKGRDDSENFRIRAEDDDGNYIRNRRDPSEFVETNGFTLGTMVIRRQENNAKANWFGTRTFAQNRFGKIYSRKELVTPNLPAEIAALFEEKAVARGEYARAENEKRFGNASASPQADADNAAGAGDDLAFGEPDHRGGLTPR